jgi:hypothetical protein
LLIANVASRYDGADRGNRCCLFTQINRDAITTFDLFFVVSIAALKQLHWPTLAWGGAWLPEGKFPTFGQDVNKRRRAVTIKFCK